MIYQNPQILYALLALAIPIIIHLFNFRKHEKVYFSSIRFLEEIKNMPNLWVQGLYTHLSFKDDISMKFTRERLSLFYEMLKNVKQKGHVIPITQALASSALIMGLDDKCTAICPGHVLYGLSWVITISEQMSV